MKERLQGLRKDRGLTLADVEKDTGIRRFALQSAVGAPAGERRHGRD